MSKRDPWSFNWLALTGLLVVAPHASRVPIWLSALFLATMAWQWVSIQRAWYLPGKIVRLVFTIVLLLAIFKEYGTLLGRDAGAGMLMGLAGLKFLELRYLRDYMMTTFVFYMLIGVNFLYEQTLIHGVYLLVTVFLTTATLVRLNLPTTKNWRFHLSLTGGMLLRALPLMLIMYLLFPRIQGGLWNLPTDAHSGKTGLSSEISAGSISRLVQSEATAFRVEFEGVIPPPNQRYWRTLVLWKTDGKKWKQGATPYIDSSKQKLKVVGEPVKYTVTLEASGKHWRPALDVPLREENSSRYRTGFLVEAKTAQHQRVRYSLESNTRYHTGPLSKFEKKLGLALPGNNSTRVKNLVEKWRSQSGTDLEYVQKALAHFGGQAFRYTLKPPLLGSNPVDDFLFNTQSGFCEHYATTFVTLMRLAGIPSRVVAGYQGGELNEGSNYLIVRQSDAHAWTEVWLKESGWLRVDPTAAIAPERIELGIDAIRRLEEQGLRPGSLSGDALANIVNLDFLEKLWRQSRQTWDAVNLGWFRWTTGYDIDKQMDFLRKLGLKTPDWFGLIIGLVAGVALFVFMIFISLKRADKDYEPLQKIYRRFESKLFRSGIKRKVSEGPLDFAARVGSLKPEFISPVSEITQLYIQLRYNPPEEITHKLLGSIRQRVREFQPDKLLANAEA